MKKTIMAGSLIIFITVTVSVVKSKTAAPKDFTVDYGESEIYTKEDMENAVEEIMNVFNSFDSKCDMYSIKYCGDETSVKNVGYCNELSNVTMDECIVFESTFKTPGNAGGGFNSNFVYEGWKWYLARQKDGEWVVLTYGYA